LDFIFIFNMPICLLKKYCNDKKVGYQIVGMHPGASEYAFEYQQVRPIRLADAPGCIPTG
jgi:hypothetical protein